MEASFGKRDDGGDSGFGRRSERPGGPSEGEFRRGYGIGRSQNGSTAKPLIKAVVADFETSQGRTTARDGLAEKLKGLKPAEITAKCIETLGQAGALVDEKAPDDACDCSCHVGLLART
jgi:hypothetical protein